VSVPKISADRIVEVRPGLYHWSIADDRLDGFRSDAWAVATEVGAVLIDPLPVAEPALGALGAIAAICLTASSHQRAAWNLRRLLGVAVWAPAGTGAVLEERADREYRERDVLPGGLRAYSAPGPRGEHHALLATVPDGRRVLFVGDLVLTDGKALRLLPREHLASPELATGSALRLAGLAADIVAPAHGEPVTERAMEALRRARW